MASKTKVYSLTTVNVVITNANGNGNQLTISGSNKVNMGEIKYSFDNDIFTGVSTPDGGYAVSHNGSRAGRISITFKQISPLVNELVEFYEDARTNPNGAESNITVTDSLNNFQFKANQVFPVKIPDNVAGEAIADRTFEFISGEIINEILN